jgi:RNA polymerase sigma factor (sigma-70 family)
MRQVGLGPRRALLLGSSLSQNDTSSSFEQLALPLLDSAYNFAYWLAQNRDNAEDLVQETYLKALRGFASFRPGSNFRAWLFQILKNTFLTSCSEAKRGSTVPLDSDEVVPLLPVNSTSAESMLVDRSRSDTIRVAIEQLPIAFREVILLCDVEDASYREIAEILSIPIGTVMSRLARARKAVRESLSNCAPEATNNLMRSRAARS